MAQRNYPVNWDDLRRQVLDRHLHRCVNCHTIGGDNCLEVHHIVPVGQAGSHRPSNLVPLCHNCHRAAHGEKMAPRVRWYSRGEMSGREFKEHKRLWKEMREQLGYPRYDPDEECVYIPASDVDPLLDQLYS